MSTESTDPSMNSSSHGGQQLAETMMSLQQELAGNAPLKWVGNYKLIRKIGEGTFSTVYFAQHLMTGGSVVLKKVPKSQPNLVAEITSLRSFRHPHIARLYEYIMTETQVWLVLEYAGEELFQKLVTDGAAPTAWTQRIFAQLAGALAYAHARNCAHRDLKLENVMLDSEGNVKLGDFGFTRIYAPRALLETVCGTEAYMAPEMLLRQKYRPEAADVWSLGVILYALIYNRLPFDEESDSATKYNVINKEPEWPIRPLGDEAPYDAGLIRLCKSMLQKDPKKRPNTCEILECGALGEYGLQQLSLVNAPEPMLFSTRQERRLLKRLHAFGYDIRVLANSLNSHACDPLQGLWYTAINERIRKEALERTRSESRSLKSVARVARAIVRSPSQHCKSVDSEARSPPARKARFDVFTDAAQLSRQEHAETPLSQKNLIYIEPGSPLSTKRTSMSRQQKKPVSKSKDPTQRLGEEDGPRCFSDNVATLRKSSDKKNGVMQMLSSFFNKKRNANIYHGQSKIPLISRSPGNQVNGSMSPTKDDCVTRRLGGKEGNAEEGNKDNCIDLLPNVISNHVALRNERVTEHSIAFEPAAHGIDRDNSSPDVSCKFLNDDSIKSNLESDRINGNSFDSSSHFVQGSERRASTSSVNSSWRLNDDQASPLSRRLSLSLSRPLSQISQLSMFSQLSAFSSLSQTSFGRSITGSIAEEIEQERKQTSPFIRKPSTIAMPRGLNMNRHITPKIIEDEEQEVKEF